MAPKAVSFSDKYKSALTRRVEGVIFHFFLDMEYGYAVYYSIKYVLGFHHRRFWKWNRKESNALRLSRKTKERGHRSP